MKPFDKGRSLLALDRIRFGDVLSTPDAGTYGVDTAVRYTKARAVFDSPADGIVELAAPAWERLVKDTLFALERLAPVLAMRFSSGALLGNDPKKRKAAFKDIQAWIRQNADVQSRNPILAFVATLPDDTGGAGFFSDYGSTQLAAGRFPQMRNCLDGLSWDLVPPRSYYVQSGQAKGNWFASRSEIGPFLRRLKAAMAVRLPRWKKEQGAMDVQRLERGASDLEWFFANPLADSADQSLLDRLFLEQRVFDGFAVTDGADKSISWPVILHELWFDQENFKRQWMDSAGGGWVNAFSIPAFQNDPVVEGKLRELIRPVNGALDSWGTIGGKPVWEKNAVGVFIGGYDAVHAINKYEFERDNPGTTFRYGSHYGQYAAVRMEDGTVQYSSEPNGPTVKAIERLVRQYFWDRTMIPLRSLTQKMARGSESARRVREFGEGFYRSFFSYLAFLEHSGGRAEMLAVLNGSEPRFADGAKANRSQDIMNAHVIEKRIKADARHIDCAYRTEWGVDEMRRRGFLSDAQAARLKKYFSDKDVSDESVGVEYAVYLSHADSFSQWRIEHARSFGIESNTLAATREIYVFSDTIAESKQGIVLAEPALNARLIPPVLNPEIASIAEAVRRGEDVAGDLRKWTADAMKWMPEAHLFRDFFLENASHVGLFLELRKSFSAEELAANGIALDIRTVDLRDHLDGKDNGVLKRAYMTAYPIIRVRGLEKASLKFSVGQKKAIADYLTDRAKLMTSATGEFFERMATELEIDALREEYRKMRDHLEPKGRVLSDEQRVAAGQRAFELVLGHVVARFPRATQHRDSILTSLMSDLATSGDQALTLEKMTFSYYVRHPGERESESSEAFSATETVKNYLAMFQDRRSRRIVLSWFFGGPMPEDRLIEGEAFKVNEQEKVDAFWMLSGEERRAIFYSALLGEHGLFECPPFSYDPTRHTGGSEREIHTFVRDFYDDNFAALFPEERTSKAFRLAFVEAFTQYTPARRVELLLSLADRMRELRMSGEKLSAGEAIRLLLEQVGVVGVKTGQVLAEQKDVLPDDMRSDLSSLKDRATPFNKNGVFTYVRSVGWYEDGEGRSAMSEVGEIVGSASIKQVHRVRLKSGEELALKVQRPGLGRCFAEDMRVLGHVVDAFRREGYDVPQWLLPEVRRVVEAEMDFGREARSSRTIGESLARRRASLSVDGRNLPLSVPEIRAIHTKETDPRRNMQLMMETFAHGLTLEDVRRLQSGTTAESLPTPSVGNKQADELDGIREKLRRLYGDVAPAMERRYAELDLQAVQAQLAVELLTQIAEDPMFHADLHRGNAIVNLSAGHEGISLIDLGSAGESKPEFLELSAHLLMLKHGMGSPERVAEILATYAPANLSPEEWTNLVTETVAAGETVEDVFKELLARLLKATGGTMDQNLRYLLKALASAGGHFQALQERIMTTTINAAMVDGSTTESRQMAVLMSPEVQMLLPLLPRVPFLAAMVGV